MTMTLLRNFKIEMKGNKVNKNITRDVQKCNSENAENKKETNGESINVYAEKISIAIQSRNSVTAMAIFLKDQQCEEKGEKGNITYM